MDKFKLGIDLHGISDKAPEFFSIITKLLIEKGHEVHIMTGEHESDTLYGQIKKCKLSYTHIFSIADWHKKRGTEMSYDSNGNPWMSAKDWDSSKGVYAEEQGLDLVIDDTPRYAPYFVDCIFMAADIQLPGVKAQEWMKMRRKGMEEAANNNTWIRKDRNLEKEGYPNVVGLLIRSKEEGLEFQELIDASYSQGIDLYKCFHKLNSDDKFNYHFFLNEPFSNDKEWIDCVNFLKNKSDRRIFKQK